MIDLRVAAGRVAEEWARRFAGWEPGLFAEVAATSGVALAGALGEDAGADRVLDAYLRLVAEALRLRYLDRAPPGVGTPEPNLVARCLVDVIPRRLPAYPAGERLALLARVWNLGEGLLRQPPWMVRIASALVRDADDLEHLDEAVGLALEPLIGERPRSTFAGPFDVHVVDLRTAEEDFLPGAMHAAAPCVLCVHDRLREDVQVAVLAARGRASRSLGTTPCPRDGSGAAGAEESGVAVRIAGGRASIGTGDVPLPALRQAYSHAVLSSGFLAVSGADSQRLWVVESAS